MAQISDDTLAHLRGAVWPALEASWGLPAGLLSAIAHWETRGSYSIATGPAGGRGIFQLTPIALEQIRRDTGLVIDPINPYTASVGAAALLARYTRLFRYPSLIVAAYNWGEGNVRRFIQAVATQGRALMPLETRQYIANTVGQL